MPVEQGEDNKGKYYQYGYQKKYYYKVGDSESRKQAKTKAGLQAKAIKIQQLKKTK